MTKMTYREQLLHPNWQRKRLEVLQAAEFKCSCCYDGESTLHVHHKRYIKGRMAWEYEGEELAALCESCHGQEHERMRGFDVAVMRMPLDGGPWSFQEFCGVAAGWAMPALEDRDEAIELAGGDGFLRSVAVGVLARDILWAGNAAWPEQAMRDMASVVEDAEFVRDVADAIARAMQRSAAAWAASGL
jgi:hypothetical protein